MKKAVHPQYFDAQVVCSCGARFTVGSTRETIHVELCDSCHPFYTGQQRFVDTASRIDKFKRKQEVASAVIKKKKEDKVKKEEYQPQTLREMLQALKR